MDKRTEEVLGTYESLAKEHGVGTLGALGWSSKEVQETRFQYILDGLGGGQGSMLDVGCGVGDIINAHGFSQRVSSYVGIDVLGENIERARTKFEKMGNARFIQGDYLDYLAGAFYDELFDFVVASGLFALYPVFNVQKTLGKMWKATAGVMAFNITVPRTLAMRDLITVLEYVGVEKYVVRNDYLEGDVTVHGYKD